MWIFNCKAAEQFSLQGWTSSCSLFCTQGKSNSPCLYGDCLVWGPEHKKINEDEDSLKQWMQLEDALQPELKSASPHPSMTWKWLCCSLFAYSEVEMSPQWQLQEWGIPCIYILFPWNPFLFFPTLFLLTVFLALLHHSYRSSQAETSAMNIHIPFLTFTALTNMCTVAPIKPLSFISPSLFSPMISALPTQQFLPSAFLFLLDLSHFPSLTALLVWMWLCYLSYQSRQHSPMLLGPL